MKHLTTLVTLFLSCTMLAQGPVEFPWNPDSDGDDFIGVNDLMALLGEYSTSFSEEALYVSQDSSSAMYFAGDLGYVQCQGACAQLPGRWRMPRLEEIIIEPQEMWLRTNQDELTYVSSKHAAMYIVDSDGWIAREYTQYSKHCFCATQERPKVEYVTCTSDDNNNFVTCCQERAAAGWWPLSGSNPSSAGNDIRTWSQAFWRWAE